jgi:hypothetical protein
MVEGRSDGVFIYTHGAKVMPHYLRRGCRGTITYSVYFDAAAAERISRRTASIANNPPCGGGGNSKKDNPTV